MAESQEQHFGALLPSVTMFYEQLRLKMEQYKSGLPGNHNSDVIGAYTEEVLKSFITKWVTPCSLYTGALYKTLSTAKTPLQIDVIIHDPRQRPVVLQEGAFAVIHPAFVPGILEIKRTVKSRPGLSDDLEKIFQTHFRTNRFRVCGVVVIDRNPSAFNNSSEDLGICPTFCLMNRKLELHRPGVEGLMHCIYKMTDRGLPSIR